MRGTLSTEKPVTCCAFDRMARHGHWFSFAFFICAYVFSQVNYTFDGSDFFVFPPLLVVCLLVQREMDTLFATILDDGHNLVGAAKCSLFFVDEEKGEVWTKVATDNDGEIKVS